MNTDIWMTEETQRWLDNTESFHVTIEEQAKIVRENNIDQSNGIVELDNYDVHEFSTFIKELVTESCFTIDSVDYELVDWEQIAEEWL